MADSSSGLPRLTVLTGSMAGKELVLEEVVDNILIGSDASCRFHLPLPGISPIHARIWMDAAGVTVYDTHSPRGLYVNDDRVSGQVPLKNGDILWLGTPGEDEAVMIQCRFPSRTAAVQPPPVTTTPPESETESTVVMTAPVFEEPAEALELVEEPAEESGADATMVMGPAGTPTPELEAVEEPADAADATMVMGVPEETMVMAAPAEEAPAEPESDATLVGGADAFYIQDEEQTRAIPAVEDDPVRFAVDAPEAPPVAASEPPTFEDETSVLPPVPAYEPEPEPVPPPPPEPAPPVLAPPLTPVPISAPVAAKPVRPAAVAPAAPTPRPSPPRAASSGAGRYVALGAVGLIVLGGGSFVAWRLLQSTPAPTATPPTTLATLEVPTATLGTPPPTAPPQTAAAEPVVEEMITIVKSPPPSAAPGASPAPGAKPTPPPKTAAATPAPVSAEALRAQQTAAQVASLLGQAQSAATARNFDGAAQFYEEILKLEPQNPQAMEGRSSAQAAALSLKKTFVAGKTTVRSEKTAKGPAGFDSEDVSVAKAPDYSGRIEFEANPKNVKPGDSYTILVYLLNDGKKSFKLGSASVTTAVNGAKSGGSIQTKVKDVDPQQRVLLAETPGVWQGGTTNWSVEVQLASSRGDTFRNVLTWK